MWLDDPEVSRHHCVIATVSGISQIRDLESRNKTLVNGEAAGAAPLLDNDEITVGASVFRYAAKELAMEFREGITILAPGDSRFFSPSPEKGTPPGTLREFRTLLRLSNILHSIRDIAQIGPGEDDLPLRTRLESVLLDMIPAGRAAVLPSDAENEAVRKACERRVALLMPHPTESGMTVIAAPIITRSDVPAAIYMESASGGAPFDDADLQFIAAVAEIAAVAWENAKLVSWLEQENQRMEHALGIDSGMLGESIPQRELQRQIARVAGSDATVLVVGETGTGKELVAHAIHRHSRRAHGPFVAINCASFADSLLESELFGHERGAFTGAVARKRGRLELADGGTLFLDEIGELALPLQAKLLRVVETRTMERVGGLASIRLDIRIVSATNRDLEDAVRQGAFRQDLYFRLRVVTLRTPALRDCPNDIMLLAEHFAKDFAQRSGRKLIGFDPGVRACLQAHSWPGNVRELKHAMESAVVLGSGEMLFAEDLPEEIRLHAPADGLDEGAYTQAIENARRDVILKAFARAEYSHDTAARILGLHPTYLYKLMRRLDLTVGKG